MDTYINLLTYDDREGKRDAELEDANGPELSVVPTVVYIGCK